MHTESTFSELVTDKKPKNEWRQSIFLVTINTNKSYNSRDPKTLELMPKLRETFDNMLHQLFDRRNLIKLLVDLGRPGSGEKKLLQPENVKDIEAHTQVEVNEEGRAFLHSHTTIKVTHNTRVHVNLKLLRAVVGKVLKPVGVSNPFVSVRGVKTTFNVEEYVK